MDFRKHSYRAGVSILENSQTLAPLWQEIQTALISISEADIQDEFRKPAGKKNLTPEGNDKSISKVLNKLIKERLTASGWVAESAIFAQDEFQNSYSYDKNGKIRKSKLGVWRLDFAKQTSIQRNGVEEPIGISVEVAFNHGEAIAWNLIKPVLAAELNHVPKETDIGEGVGILICATSGMKGAGGFDGAIGEYEKVLSYLDALRTQLSIPLVIVGLEAPETFHIRWENRGPNKVVGFIAEGPLPQELARARRVQ
jgi:hypothetical protein